MSPEIQTLTGDAALLLPEFDDPPAEPLGLLRQWLSGAAERGVREPYAMVLSTADAEGRASGRVVVLKELDDHGLVFTGDGESRKGREMAANPWASAVFFWRETLQQVTASGTVVALPGQDSDALFAERPRAAQATSAVSRQSQPLRDEAELRARAAELLAGDEPIRRPAHWNAYRIRPADLEFWHGSPDRLHRRLRYERRAGAWSHRRLYP